MARVAVRLDVVTVCCQETESARVPACRPAPARGSRGPRAAGHGPGTRVHRTPQEPQLPPGGGGAQQQDRGEGNALTSY